MGYKVKYALSFKIVSTLHTLALCKIGGFLLVEQIIEVQFLQISRNFVFYMYQNVQNSRTLPYTESELQHNHLETHLIVTKFLYRNWA